MATFRLGRRFSPEPPSGEADRSLLPLLSIRWRLLESFLAGAAKAGAVAVGGEADRLVPAMDDEDEAASGCTSGTAACSAILLLVKKGGGERLPMARVCCDVMDLLKVQILDHSDRMS